MADHEADKLLRKATITSTHLLGAHAAANAHRERDMSAKKVSQACPKHAKNRKREWWDLIMLHYSRDKWGIQ